MENFLYYLLKVSVGTAVFYITYHFLFRKSKQFVFNRLYLAGSFLASFIIPLITFKRKTYLTEAYSYFAADPASIPDTMAYAPETGVSMGFPEYLLIMYLSGVIFFLTKLVYSLIVAARIKAKSTPEQIAGMEINVSGENVRAFTFFDRIVIGRNILCHPSLTMVLVHESVHSREKHFMDILTAEFLFMLQWFNPFAWLKRRAIRNNLEFRADDVVARSFDQREYQMAMLSMAQNTVRSPLVIEYSSSNLKKRIIMMKSNRNNKFSGIVRLAIIPVSAILLLSLSGKKTVIIPATENATSQIEMNSPQQEDNMTSTNSLTQDEVETVDSLRKFIAKNIKYPREAAEAGQMGYVSLFASVNDNGNITDIGTIEPDGDYVDIDEVVVVGYSLPETELAESSNHETLISEGRRVINSFPEVNIPELKGKTAKFNLRFVLVPDSRSQQKNTPTGKDPGERDTSLNARMDPDVRDIQPALAVPNPTNKLLPMEVIWPNVRHDSDDLITIEEVGKYLNYYRRYPADEAMAGHTGTVELYAMINNDGWVEAVSEQPPSGNYFEIKDTISMKLGVSTPSIESSQHPGLIAAGHRSLLTLPRLNIPELQGKAIKVTFKWGLYNN